MAVRLGPPRRLCCRLGGAVAQLPPPLAPRRCAVPLGRLWSQQCAAADPPVRRQPTARWQPAAHRPRAGGHRHAASGQARSAAERAHQRQLAHWPAEAAGHGSTRQRHGLAIPGAARRRADAARATAAGRTLARRGAAQPRPAAAPQDGAAADLPPARTGGITQQPHPAAAGICGCGSARAGPLQPRARQLGAAAAPPAATARHGWQGRSSSSTTARSTPAAAAAA